MRSMGAIYRLLIPNSRRIWTVSSTMIYTGNGFTKLHKQNCRTFFVKSIGLSFNPTLRAIKTVPKAKYFPNQIKSNSNSLVVLVSWLKASEPNTMKYVDFWHRQGFDVLKLPMNWAEIMYPLFTLSPKGQSLTDCLNILINQYPNVIFHTFSSGCYYYAAVVEAIEEDKRKYDRLSKCIKGVIFDSMIDWDHSMDSKALLLTHNYLAMKLLSKLFSVYYIFTHPFTTTCFHYAHNVIERNPLRISVLMLYSNKDPFINIKKTETNIETWKDEDIVVHHKCWNDAPHVQIYRMYPEEYTQLIEQFLKDINVSNAELKEQKPGNPLNPNGFCFPEGK